MTTSLSMLRLPSSLFSSALTSAASSRPGTKEHYSNRFFLKREHNFIRSVITHRIFWKSTVTLARPYLTRPALHSNAGNLSGVQGSCLEKHISLLTCLDSQLQCIQRARQKLGYFMSFSNLSRHIILTVNQGRYLP